MIKIKEKKKKEEKIILGILIYIISGIKQRKQNEVIDKQSNKQILKQTNKQKFTYCY